MTHLGSTSFNMFSSDIQESSEERGYYCLLICTHFRHWSRTSANNVPKWFAKASWRASGSWQNQGFTSVSNTSHSKEPGPPSKPSPNRPIPWHLFGLSKVGGVPPGAQGAQGNPKGSALQSMVLIFGQEACCLSVKSSPALDVKHVLVSEVRIHDNPTKKKRFQPHHRYRACLFRKIEEWSTCGETSNK